MAASLDQGSEPPLAHALVAAARRRELGLSTPENFESASGIGAHGRVDGKAVAIGNTTLMEEEGVDWRPLGAQAEALRQEGASVMFLAMAGQAAGLIAVSNPIKASTREALDSLRASGLSIVMATGDGLTTVRAVGRKLGIGDGINDASVVGNALRLRRAER